MRSSRIRSDDACVRSTACRPRLDAAAPGAGNATAMSGARPEDQALRLRRALRRQTELNRLQREFMLMAAHEFGTPLAIIDSQAQGLARRAERIAPDDLRRRLEKIRAAVARMNEMVQRSLAAFSSSLTDVDEPGALADPGDDADLLGEVGESRRVEIDMPRLVGDTCRAYQELSSAHQIVQDLDGLPPVGLGRPRAGPPDPRQPARQRDQVLAARRPHRGHRTDRRRRGGHQHPRRGPRHRGAGPRQDLPPVLPRGEHDRDRRHRARPEPGAEGDRAARRRDRGRERGGRGLDLHGQPADRSARQPAGGGAGAAAHAAAPPAGG